MKRGEERRTGEKKREQEEERAAKGRQEEEKRTRGREREEEGNLICYWWQTFFECLLFSNSLNLLNLLESSRKALPILQMRNRQYFGFRLPWKGKAKS
jgi:hypothetical protein